jgi:PAS domain S-box-containing protein
VLRFKWKLFFGFLTFGIIVVALTAAQQRVVSYPLVTIAVAVVASLPSAFFIASRLNRPVSLLNDGIARVAAGDLNVRLPHPRTRDEFEPLIDRFNAMVVALRETRQLRETLAVREQAERVLRETGERLEVSVRERTRELEQAIRERDRYVAHSLDLICVASLDGWFKTVNPAFERVLGYTPEEITSAPFIGLVHPDDVQQTAVEIERLAGGLPTVLFENRYRCKDGTYKWLQWTAIPLAEEKVVYAIARDITDKRRAEAAEQALLESSLQMSVAQKIQASLLPADIVHLEGFDVAGVSRPAALVGGDYFDFIPMAGNQLVIALADASGHGLSAALVMAQMHACLWSLLVADPHPIEEVLARANAMLYAKTPANCFATALLVSLDANARTVTWASCGHPAAYLLDAGGDVKCRIDSTARPLGCFAEHEVCTAAPVPLSAGDTLVLATDGVLEAESSEGEMFGETRLLEAARACQHLTSREIAETVQDRLAQFCDRQADDATVVVMKVTAEEPRSVAAADWERAAAVRGDALQI